MCSVEGGVDQAADVALRGQAACLDLGGEFIGDFNRDLHGISLMEME